jgi:hypothetical protein
VYGAKCLPMSPRPRVSTPLNRAAGWACCSDSRWLVPRSVRGDSRLLVPVQDTAAVEAAVRITARRQGGAAAAVAGQPLEGLVTHDSMAWAAATALSRGFNLQRQDFDGRKQSRCWSQSAGVQSTKAPIVAQRFPRVPATPATFSASRPQMMLTQATGRTSGAPPTPCWCRGSTC